MLEANNNEKFLGEEASKIWNQIKDLDLNMFAMPNQFLHKYCTPHYVEPSKLYVTISAGAVGPALEELLGKHFNIENAGKYIVIFRK